MALITCPDCGREVANKARICPNCGHIFEEQEGRLSRLVLVPTLAFLIGGLAGGLVIVVLKGWT